MNLQLYAVRNRHQNQSTERWIQLVVIDLDKSPHYPLNFVCVFPKYLRFIEKRPSQFVSIFGLKSLQIARKLLTEASQTEKDPEIRKILKNRTKKLISNNEKNRKTVCVGMSNRYINP